MKMCQSNLFSPVIGKMTDCESTLDTVPLLVVANSPLLELTRNTLLFLVAPEFWLGGASESAPGLLGSRFPRMK